MWNHKCCNQISNHKWCIQICNNKWYEQICNYQWYNQICNCKWCNIYTITNDVIKFAITNDVIKFAITNDVIKKIIFLVSKHACATHARCYVLVPLVAWHKMEDENRTVPFYSQSTSCRGYRIGCVRHGHG